MSFDVSQTNLAASTSYDRPNNNPIRALDGDIGIEILKAAFQHRFPSCHCDKGVSPVPISHVNRWWRRLALSTPQIWTCIHVVTTHPDREDSSEMIEAYLLRSRNHPLSITIACHTERLEAMLRYGPSASEWTLFKETVGRRYIRAWQLAFAHHPRWRHCAVFARRREFFDEFIKDMQGVTFPKLEHLGFYLPFHYPGQTSYNFDFTTPQLLRLDCSRCNLTLSPAAFATLVELRVARTITTSNDFLKALGSASIVTLVLADIVVRGDAAVGLATFPTLRNLYLSRMSTRKAFILALLDGAHNLTTLHLEDVEALDMTSFAVDMILSTVQKLTIVNLESLPEMQWFDFLRRFPAVRALRLIRNAGVDSDGMALRAMRMSDERGQGQGGVCLLPSLEVLVMEYFVCHEVLLFVRHRASNGYPISEVLLPEVFVMGEHQFVRDVSSFCKLYTLSLTRMYAIFAPRFTFWDRDRDTPQFYALEDEERLSCGERKLVI